jgi:hypothetical protein
MRIFRIFGSKSVLIVAVCLWAVSVSAVEKDASYQAALESITAEDLGEYVAHLADPAMEGREAGTRGGRAAGDYLVERYTQAHLQPAGIDGGYTQPFPPDFRNILAMLPGSDPELKDQVIIVGAHYDHVGFGTRRNSLGQVGLVHPGADDNASGTSAVLKLAEAFTMLPNAPKRSILFAAWDAEEKGMLGTRYWLAHSTLPLDHVKAVINLDMIGYLRDDHVLVYGDRTSFGWRRLLSFQNDGQGLQLEFSWMMKPVADHYAFFKSDLPVIMLHTGLHDNYHRPTDFSKFINNEGMMRVTRLMFGAIHDLADRSSPLPSFRVASRRETPETEKAILANIAKPADRLGIGWTNDPAEDHEIVISQITPNSPAERAGLRVGDRMTQFAGRPIQSDDDFFYAVSSAENDVSLSISRTDSPDPATVAVKLDGLPLRWGVSWRVDDAEPGTIILTYVVPGSPAAKAGLQIGDRVYQVADHDIPDETVFVQWTKTFSTPVSMLVERDGKLRTVTLPLGSAESIRRAA